MASQPRQLDKLAELERDLSEQASLAIHSRGSLEALRMRSKAASAILSRLASTPPDSPPRSFVDVLIVSRSKDWEEEMKRRLQVVLPNAEINLGQPGERLPEPQPVPHTISCAITVPGMPASTARRKVLSTFAKMDDVEVDYSEPIDLIVVKPLQG